MSIEPPKETDAFVPVPDIEPTEIKGIVRNQRIFGGKPIIGGHRISVHDIAARIHQGYTAEQIASDDVYPTLTLAEVYAALHYYYDHKEEIDREITEETAEQKRLAQESMSPFALRLRQHIKEQHKHKRKASKTGESGLEGGV